MANEEKEVSKTPDKIVYLENLKGTFYNGATGLRSLEGECLAAPSHDGFTPADPLLAKAREGKFFRQVDKDYYDKWKKEHDEKVAKAAEKKKERKEAIAAKQKNKTSTAATERKTANSGKTTTTKPKDKLPTE